MSWNNRVSVVKNTTEHYTEFSASIHEVHYHENNKVSYSPEMVTAEGSTPEEAISQLKEHLELQLHAINLVLQGKTQIFDPEDRSTYSNSTIPKVLDRDDAYLDEKYGAEDE